MQFLIYLTVLMISVSTVLLEIHWLTTAPPQPKATVGTAAAPLPLKPEGPNAALSPVYPKKLELISATKLSQPAGASLHHQHQRRRHIGDDHVCAIAGHGKRQRAAAKFTHGDKSTHRDNGRLNARERNATDHCCGKSSGGSELATVSRDRDVSEPLRCSGMCQCLPVIPRVGLQLSAIRGLAPFLPETAGPADRARSAGARAPLEP